MSGEVVAKNSYLVVATAKLAHKRSWRYGGSVLIVIAVYLPELLQLILFTFILAVESQLGKQVKKSLSSCSGQNIFLSGWLEESLRILENVSAVSVIKRPSGIFKDRWVFIFQKNGCLAL